MFDTVSDEGGRNYLRQASLLPVNREGDCVA